MEKQLITFDIWKDLGYMATFSSLDDAMQYIKKAKNNDSKFNIEFMYRIFKNTYSEDELIKFEEVEV